MRRDSGAQTPGEPSALTRRRGLAVLGTIIGAGTLTAAPGSLPVSGQQSSEFDIEIERAASAPTLDGELDSSWEARRSYPMDTVIRGEGTPSDADASGSWRTAWDSDALYVFVSITDEKLIKESSSEYIFQDDCVELFIDGDHSQGDSYDGENDAEYAIRWNDPDVAVGANSIENTDGIEHAQIRTEAGYQLELSVPWQTLGVSVAAGDLIGIDCHYNDDDTGGDRDHKIAWHSETDDTWKTPSLMASAKLVDSNESGPTTSDSTSTATPGSTSTSEPTSSATATNTSDQQTDDSTSSDGLAGFGLATGLTAGALALAGVARRRFDR